MPESDSFSSLNCKNEVIIVGKSNKRKYFFSSNPFSSFKRITLWNHPGITSLPLKREPGSCSGSSAKQALEKGTCIISIVRCHQIVVDLLKLQIYVASVQKKDVFFTKENFLLRKKIMYVQARSIHAYQHHIELTS